MLRAPRTASIARRSTGYSLIELMISITLGLIVVGGVLTIIVSILASNAETIRVTRLTQELRTIAEVVGREAERARFMTDPLTNVGNRIDPANPALGASNPNSLVDDSTAGCLRFSYAEPDNVAGDTDNTAVTFSLRDGVLFVNRTTDAALEDWTGPDTKVRKRTTLVACNSAVTRLNSPELTLTSFDVRVLDDADANADGWVDCTQPDSILTLSITGRLASDANTVRTVTERVRIGSVDLKPNPACYL